MKQYLLFLLISISIVAFAQTNDPFSPVMKFEKDTFDFGTIKKGADGNCVFTFINTGREKLEIESVQSECACIVTEYPKRPIKKGKTGTIKVYYYTQRVGPIDKTITIKSNTWEGIKTLKITGNVEGS